MIPCATIIGLATCAPERSISQQRAGRIAAEIEGLDDAARERLLKLYRNSGIDTRGSVIVEGEDDCDFDAPFLRGDDAPGTDARMQRWLQEATPLSLRASAQALHDASIEARQITHVITVSCTGFAAPGIDHALIRELALPTKVQRLNVGFMGCHGVSNALSVARSHCLADPEAIVLISSVELCSIHYQRNAPRDQVVANAIFADGAASLVIAGAAHKGKGFGVRACASQMLPDTHEQMGWRIGDTGFAMNLSPRVPRTIEKELKPALTDFLSHHELKITDIGGWAVHPGGVKILDAVESALGLPDHALNASREVLRKHGNMSSPTVVFVMQELMRREAPRPWLMLGFGPGLAIEMTLIG